MKRANCHSFRKFHSAGKFHDAWWFWLLGWWVKFKPSFESFVSFVSLSRRPVVQKIQDLSNNSQDPNGVDWAAPTICRGTCPQGPQPSHLVATLLASSIWGGKIKQPPLPPKNKGFTYWASETCLFSLACFFLLKMSLLEMFTEAIHSLQQNPPKHRNSRNSDYLSWFDAVFIHIHRILTSWAPNHHESPTTAPVFQDDVCLEEFFGRTSDLQMQLAPLRIWTVRPKLKPIPCLSENYVSQTKKCIYKSNLGEVEPKEIKETTNKHNSHSNPK